MAMEENQKIIEIDGSFGEGGGQILRTATSLSALFKIPCHIFKIRQKRENPGLAKQHLLYLEALCELTQGRLEGNYLGSQEIKFYPGDFWKESLKIKIDSAASITLILQGLLLPALFSKNKTRVIFEGGATDTFFAPPFDYFNFVFLSFLDKFLEKVFKKKVLKIDLGLKKRGFYPKGGGEVEVEIYPLPYLAKFEKIDFPKDKGKILKIKVFSLASEDLRERKVAERQISGIRQTSLFYSKFKIPIKIEVDYLKTLSSGSVITVIGEFENGIFGESALGELGKSAESVGKEVGEKFFEEIKKGGIVDKHLADQILPYLALLTKEALLNVGEISLHTKTNAWVIEKFLKGRFELKENQICWKR
jgi:RNA 3'-terminal phosphate cyclase (ATP)